ncbi:MAG: AAA family ATPase, partial [Dehalococcoidia bacterium]|nr:AAA family ATPase [Dehalococcoidia bacterium]
MIKRVSLQYFKRFSRQEFELYEHVVLAGPNNSGKSTLLQAISVWNLALQRWLAERGPESGSTAKKRTGVAITRKDFTAIPLRELSLLWTDGITALRQDEVQPAQKPGYPRFLTITLQTQGWDLAFEFFYQSSELLYVKPSGQHMNNLAKAADSFKVVHVPAFSGIGAEETRYDRPYQDLLIGQGKPGDILRNLLLEVHQQDNKSNWAELTRQVEDIFGYKLQHPLYEGRPYILCEYLQPESSGEKTRWTKLDVASAGSGFHQVLLLLGFFYARPATILLLDEPDAHLHVILQKEIYDLLRRIAAKRECQ